MSVYSSNVNISGNTIFSGNSASWDGGALCVLCSNVYMPRLAVIQLGLGGVSLYKKTTQILLV